MTKRPFQGVFIFACKKKPVFDLSRKTDLLTPLRDSTKFETCLFAVLAKFNTARRSKDEGHA